MQCIPSPSTSAAVFPPAHLTLLWTRALLHAAIPPIHIPRSCCKRPHTTLSWIAIVARPSACDSVPPEGVRGSILALVYPPGPLLARQRRRPSATFEDQGIEHRDRFCISSYWHGRPSINQHLVCIEQPIPISQVEPQYFLFWS